MGIVIGLLGCADSGAPAGTGTPATTTTPVEVARPPVPTVAVTPSSANTKRVVQDAVVGWSAKPQISAHARKANRAGLKHHRARHYAAAEEAFARAVTLSPDHDFARYNLACAQVRLGHLSSAADELLTVLNRDPARFSDRIESDPDLESLRSAVEFASVARALPRARAAWEASHDRGVPAMMYRHSAREFVDGRLKGGTDQLVVGAYRHDQGRFIPLGRGGAGALIDLPGRRWLSVGFSHFVTAADNQPHLVVGDVRLNRTFPNVESIARGDLETELPTTTDTTISFLWAELAVADAGVVGRAEWFDWKNGDVPEARKAFVIDGSGLRLSRQPLPQGPQLHVVQGGAVLQMGLADGATLRRGLLRVDANGPSFQLGRRHARAQWSSVVLDSERRYAIVTSMRWHDPKKDFDQPWHAVHRVELATGAVAELSRAEGLGHALIGPGDAIYVQAGADTRRWPTPDATTGEAIMPGVMLTTPLVAYDCGPCG